MSSMMTEPRVMLAMTVSTMQLGVCALYALILWVIGLNPVKLCGFQAPDKQALPKSTKDDIIKTVPVGFCAAAAHSWRMLRSYAAARPLRRRRRSLFRGRRRLRRCRCRSFLLSLRRRRCRLGCRGRGRQDLSWMGRGTPGTAPEGSGAAQGAQRPPRGTQEGPRSTQKAPKSTKKAPKSTKRCPGGLKTHPTSAIRRTTNPPGSP